MFCIDRFNKSNSRSYSTTARNKTPRPLLLALYEEYGPHAIDDTMFLSDEESWLLSA